jgi:hypothetical protein
LPLPCGSRSAGRSAPFAAISIHQSALQSAICNVNRQSTIRQSAVANRQSVNRQSPVGTRQLLGLFMSRVLAAEAAVLAEFEPLARLFLVLGRAVVATFALSARQGDDVSHC